jgi:hypothetical protein
MQLRLRHGIATNLNVDSRLHHQPRDTGICSNLTTSLKSRRTVATTLPQMAYYTYKPLQYPDSIRVLEIAFGRREDPIQCVLREVSRADATYKALSYAWGEPVFLEQLREISPGR